MFKKIILNFLIFCLAIGQWQGAYADLRVSPTWYQPNGVGTTDWHYRVPVTTVSTASINSTVKVDVDFASLLTQMGVSGTLDNNSVRVVRPNGTTLSTIQEFTPTVYAGATNSTANRGEVRFIVEDAGPATYYIYFDITANGIKPVNPQIPIDGNFEKGSSGQATPPGWNTPTVVNAVFDAQVRPSETVSVTTDGANVTKSTNGTPNTGNNSYLMGARTNNEPNGFSGLGTTFTKTITVPATNPGNLVFRFRIEGWDSNVNGNTTQYDFFQAQLVGTTTTTMVGPSANNYTTYPFSPAYGTTAISATTSGYGQYNSFDTTTTGTHKNGMTITPGSEPWFTVTQSLSAYAGQTITLNFQMHHTYLYRSWVSIDDVEWSVTSGTLGTPQGFGVVVTTPISTTTYNSGQVIKITAQVDAKATSVIANIYDASGTLVANNIKLYNDATHGDTTSGDAIWSNDGSDSSNFTYKIPLNVASSSAWKVQVLALDSSSSTLGVTNGLIHIPGQPTTLSQANYYNIDDQLFNVVSVINLTNNKTVTVYSDPYNGTTNPKAIPGAIMLYSIQVTNTAVGSPDPNSIAILDKIPANTILYVGDFGVAGSGPISFIDGTPSSGLTYTYTNLASTTDNLYFSNDNGTTYTYIPTPDANGYDANVTNIKIVPQGLMNPSSGSPSPSFTIQFKVKIN